MQGVWGWAWASCLHGCPPQPIPQGVRVREVTMEEEEEVAAALVNEVVGVEEEEEQAGTEVSLARPSRLHRDHTKVRRLSILCISHDPYSLSLSFSPPLSLSC